MTSRPSPKAWLAYAALAAADTWLAGRRSPRARRTRWVTKPLLMPTLAVIARPRSQAIRAGLAAGWVGDVALLGPGTGPFLAGAAAFGVGHGAYIQHLVGLQAATSLPRARTTRAIAATWLVTAPWVIRGAARQDRTLALPVAAYSALLPSMTAYALHLDPTLPARQRLLIGAGGLAFLASDTLLGFRSFLVTADSPLLDRAVMATYTLGQGLIASGAATPPVGGTVTTAGAGSAG